MSDLGKKYIPFITKHINFLETNAIKVQKFTQSKNLFLKSALKPS